MTQLCRSCFEARDDSIRVPRHLVHPEHGKLDVWSVGGEALCPTCSTLWRSTRRNAFEIAASVDADRARF